MTPDESPESQRPKIRLRRPQEGTFIEGAQPAAGETGQTRRIVGNPALASWEAIIRFDLPLRERQFGFILLLVLVGLAIGIALKTALCSLVVAFLLSAALARAIGMLVVRRVASFHAVVAAFAATVVLLGLVLLLILPVWQRQGEKYGARVVELVDMLSQKIDEAVKPPEAAVPSTDAKTNAVPTQVDTKRGPLAAMRNTVVQAVARFNAGTGTVVALRFRILVQLVILIGVALSVPLFQPTVREAPAVKPTGGSGAFLKSITSDFLNFMCKLSFYSSGRFVKALALAILTVIGLGLGGIESSLFLAGLVFVFCLLIRSGYALPMAMAMLLVAFTQNVTAAIVTTVVTWTVLMIAEKKMYWMLYVRPGLAAGLLLPEAYGLQNQGGMLEFMGGGMGVIRMVVTLVLLLGVGMVGSTVLKHSSADKQRIEVVRVADYALTAGELDKALQAYDQMLKTYPNDHDALLGLVKCAWQSKDPDQARKYADQLAAWQPQAQSGAASFSESIYQMLMRLVGHHDVPVNRAEGYEYIITGMLATDDPDLKAVRELGEKAVTINEASAETHRALALTCLLENKTEDAIKHAKRGLELQPRWKQLHGMLSEAYFVLKDWQKVIVECDAELALDPNNALIQSRKTLAQKNLTSLSGEDKTRKTISEIPLP